MKTKLEMAHEFMLAMIKAGCHDGPDLLDRAWCYADAMQAEADKREKKEQSEHVFEAIEEWQPDWSQAPDWANWWAMDMDKNCYWYEDKLHLGDVEWDRHSIGKSSKSKHYGYTGDWRNSLRKRPK